MGMRDILSHTRRQTLKDCPRKYLLQNIRGIVPLEPESEGLRMGKRFQRCIEHWAWDASSGLYESDKAEASSQDEIDAIILEQIRVEELARGYMNRYPETASAEHEFEFHSLIVGHGFIDFIINGDEGGENKLFAPIAWQEAHERKLSFDDQVTAYFAARRELGKPLSKMHYRVTVKPGIKNNTRINESWSQFRTRLRNKIRDERDKVFRPYECYRTDEQIDLWLIEAESTQLVAEMLERRAREVGDEAYYKNTNSCTMFGGCKMLDFCAGNNRGYAVDKTRALRGDEKLWYDILASSFTGKATTTDIARQAGEPNSKAYYNLSKLHDAGIIDKELIRGHAVWSRPEGASDTIEIVRP